jgi:hypothetical protein
MGKCSNAFFSETTNMIKAKLYMKVHWMVLYNLKVFCSDMKFGFPIGIKNRKFVRGPSNDHSWAVWFQIVHVVSRRNILKHFFHRVNVSKCFFSKTTWTIETKLPRNDHWKVLYKVSVFYADRKTKMAATAIHRLTSMLIYVLRWWPS